MNRKNLLISNLLIFLVTILVYFVTTFSFFKIAKNEMYDEIREYSKNIIITVNELIDEKTVINSYATNDNIYIDFYKEGSYFPYLSNYQNIKGKEAFNYEILNTESKYYSLEFKKEVISISNYSSGKRAYVVISTSLPLSYQVSKGFLIYGSLFVVLANVFYEVFSNRRFKDSLLPLKIQIKKLQNIVNTDRPIEYDDDIKYLALIVRDSRKELSEQFKLTKMGEQKINFILDSISQGLIVVDASYHIVMFNKKAEEIIKASRENIEMKNIEILKDCGRIEKNISMVIKTKRRMVFDETIDGKVYQCNINPIDYSWTRGSEQNGASLLMIDITDEYNSSKMKKEFFDNASHELKSPLTSILGYTEMISQGILTSKEEIDDAINKSIMECGRMNKIIMDMLSLSSLENEVLRPIEKLDVYKEINRIINSLEVQIKDKKLKVDINKSDLVIKMNYGDFEKMFKNLIENAVKYNKDYGKIIINIKKEKSAVSIADEGIGISEENKNRVFERFFRVDKARSRQNGGTGLGLAIVKHICNYYDFTINVQSKINSGTNFTVYFSKVN